MEESAREAAKARAIAERRAHCERWESVLDEQFSRWERANRPRAYLTAIEAKGKDGARECGHSMAQKYAHVAAALVRQGNPVATMDLLIGCTALAAHAPLLTANRAHFERIVGLRVVGS